MTSTRYLRERLAGSHLSLPAAAVIHYDYAWKGPRKRDSRIVPNLPARMNGANMRPSLTR